MQEYSIVYIALVCILHTSRLGKGCTVHMHNYEVTWASSYIILAVHIYAYNCLLVHVATHSYIYMQNQSHKFSCRHIYLVCSGWNFIQVPSGSTGHICTQYEYVWHVVGICVKQKYVIFIRVSKYNNNPCELHFSS